MVGPERPGDAVEAGAVEHRALAPDAVLGDVEHPVEPHPAGPPLAVPGPRSEREPAALAVALIAAGAAGSG